MVNANEIKVRAEIVEEQVQLFKRLGYDKRSIYGILNNACVSMAEWKDEQVRKQVRKALDEAFVFMADNSSNNPTDTYDFPVVSLKKAYDALLLISKVIDNED